LNKRNLSRKPNDTASTRLLSERRDVGDDKRSRKSEGEGGTIMEIGKKTAGGQGRKRSGTFPMKEGRRPEGR